LNFAHDVCHEFRLEELRSEFLNAIDMIMLIGKQFRMNDPVMMKFGDIQHLIRPEAIDINNSTSAYFLCHNRYLGGAGGIWNNFCKTCPPRFKSPNTVTLAAE
jgi:hypothetical protein